MALSMRAVFAAFVNFVRCLPDECICCVLYLACGERWSGGRTFQVPKKERQTARRDDFHLISDLAPEPRRGTTRTLTKYS